MTANKNTAPATLATIGNATVAADKEFYFVSFNLAGKPEVSKSDEKVLNVASVNGFPKKVELDVSVQFTLAHKAGIEIKPAPVKADWTPVKRMYKVIDPTTKKPTGEEQERPSGMEYLRSEMTLVIRVRKDSNIGFSSSGGRNVLLASAGAAVKIDEFQLNFNLYRSPRTEAERKEQERLKAEDAANGGNKRQVAKSAKSEPKPAQAQTTTTGSTAPVGGFVEAVAALAKLGLSDAQFAAAVAALAAKQ